MVPKKHEPSKSYWHPLFDHYRMSGLYFHFPGLFGPTIMLSSYNNYNSNSTSDATACMYTHSNRKIELPASFCSCLVSFLTASKIYQVEVGRHVVGALVIQSVILYRCVIRPINALQRYSGKYIMIEMEWAINETNHWPSDEN